MKESGWNYIDNMSLYSYGYGHIHSFNIFVISQSIYFNSKLTCKRLFYSLSLGNRVHCVFIFIFFVYLFFKICLFGVFCTRSYQVRINFKQIYLTNIRERNRCYHTRSRSAWPIERTLTVTTTPDQDMLDLLMGSSQVLPPQIKIYLTHWLNRYYHPRSRSAWLIELIITVTSTPDQDLLDS